MCILSNVIYLLAILVFVRSQLFVHSSAVYGLQFHNCLFTLFPDVSMNTPLFSSVNALLVLSFFWHTLFISTILILYTSVFPICLPRLSQLCRFLWTCLTQSACVFLFTLKARILFQIISDLIFSCL